VNSAPCACDVCRMTRSCWVYSFDYLEKLFGKSIEWRLDHAFCRRAAVNGLLRVFLLTREGASMGLS
jgi:hypothetical protein